MSEFFPSPNDLANHKIFDGVVITTCAASRMMMSLVRMEPNSEVKAHSHPHEQIGMVLKGRAIFKIGDEKKELAVGEFYRVPPDVVHQVWALDEGAEALDIFSPIREDYL